MSAVIRYPYLSACSYSIKKHIRQTFANIEQGVREPRSVGPMMREGAISLWQSRGGGFYGLGYAITFVSLEVLEIPELFGDLFGLFGGDGTLLGNLFALMVDFFVDTFVNMGLSFMWPGLLIESLGGVGIFIVAAGFATFDRLWRPLVERFVPELKRPADNELADKGGEEAGERSADGAEEGSTDSAEARAAESEHASDLLSEHAADPAFRESRLAEDRAVGVVVKTDK